MGVFSNAIIGGAAGGALGYMNTGTLAGVGGGAAFGAGAAGLGGPVAGMFAGNRTIAGAAQYGLMRAGRGMRAAGRGMGNIASNRGAGSALGAAAMYGTGYAQLGAAGLRGARKFIGSSAMDINTYGGAALLGLGTYSAAQIGSSVINSNGGF